MAASDHGPAAFVPSPPRPAAPPLDPALGVWQTGPAGRPTCPLCPTERGLLRCAGEEADGPSLAEALRDAPGVERVVLRPDPASPATTLLAQLRALRAVARVREARVEVAAGALDAALARALRDAGADALRLSTGGPDGATLADLRRAMSAARDAGLHASVGVTVTAENFRRLPDLAAALAPHGPGLVALGVLRPRVGRADQEALVPRLPEAAPDLARAIDLLVARRVAVAVSGVPRCLLGEHAHLADERTPTPLGVRCRRQGLPRRVCLAQPGCPVGDACAGLTVEYVRRFGWEEDALRPERVGVPTARPAGAWADALDLRPGLAFGAFVLDEVRHERGAVALTLRGAGGELTARVEARLGGRRVFARTRSFDVVHDGPDLDAGRTEALRQVALRIARRDPGGLPVPP